MEKRKHRYLIGIDPGVRTGLAIWDPEAKGFALIKTVAIHQAWAHVMFYRQWGLFVRLEDARKRTWFGQAGREQLQGAGSVKRDCKMWEDFLLDEAIDHELVAPKNNKTKLTSEAFARITGWKETTSEHGRDAAMLVYGF